MTVKSVRLSVKTQGNGDVVDLTSDVRSAARDSGVADGMVAVFVPGSTAAVTTVEYEPGLVQDLKEAYERLAPASGRYAHNRGGETNGRAHVMASIVGPSVCLPLSGGRLALGTWQQVVVFDLDDRPRTRDVVVQVVGD